MSKTTYFTVLIFVISIVILTTVQNLYERYPMIYIMCVVSLSISLLEIVQNQFKIVEHLQVSGEAVQNVGSIYNNENMVIKNLKVTGKLTVGDDKLLIDDTGNIKTNGWLDATGAIASAKELRVDGDGKQIGGKFYAKPDGSVSSAKYGPIDDFFVKYDTSLHLKNVSTGPLISDNRYMGSGLKMPAINYPILLPEKNAVFGVWNIVKP